MYRSSLRQFLRSTPRSAPRRPSTLCLTLRHASTAPTGRSASFNLGTVLAIGIMSGTAGYFGSLYLNPPPPKGIATIEEHVSLNAVYGSQDDLNSAIAEIRSALGEERVSINADERLEHGSSTNHHHSGSAFGAVVYVLSTEDVVKVVNISRKWKIPITAYSGATSLEGQFSATTPVSISIDMSGMDKVLEIHEADGDLVCQAGCQWVEINEMLAEKGIPLFFPVDPGPGATIGGMIGTGCSGTNAVRYGTAKAEWFLNVTVVLPSGEVIKTRQRARKSSAGFDTTKLFIGAEGTLGIVTEATLRLTPRLPTSVAVVQFPNVHAAVAASIEILNKGVPIQCVELCDDKQMEAINKGGFSSKQYPEVDSLFLKFQGSPEYIKQAAAVSREIVKKHGSKGFTMAKTAEEAEELWHARKAVLWSNLAMVPGCRAWSTDVCVPISSLPDLVLETKEDLAKSGIVGMVVGHVGDGNFHTALLFSNDEELEICKGIVHRMVERAIKLDGTCTGEHGVGLGKKEYITLELGPGTVELMKTIKKTLDPLNLFNPGKLYPDDIASVGGQH